MKPQSEIDILEKKLLEAKAIKEQAEKTIETFAVTARRRKEEIKDLEKKIEALKNKELPKFHLRTIQAVDQHRWLKNDREVTSYNVGYWNAIPIQKYIEPEYLITFQSSGYGTNYLEKLTKEQKDLLQEKIMELLKTIEL